MVRHEDRFMRPDNRAEVVLGPVGKPASILIRKFAKHVVSIFRRILSQRVGYFEQQRETERKVLKFKL